MMTQAFTRTIKNQPSELPGLLNDVGAFLSPYELEKKVLNTINLIMEETIINIIQQGGTEDGSHDITITIRPESDQLGLELRDNGTAFNPLSLPHEKPSPAELDEKKTELGIHLVRNMMKSMAYRRENDQNIFEIWIKL